MQIEMNFYGGQQILSERAIHQETNLTKQLQ